MSDSLLNMKAVSQMSGVPAVTLRAWERRYRAVTPRRSGTGRRQYTLRDVERLRLLARLVAQGHAIGAIATLPDPQLARLLARSSTSPGADTTNMLEALLGAVAEYRLDWLEALLAQARVKFGARDLAIHVVSPLLGEVGRRFASGKLTIAQEHALSAVLRRQLSEELRIAAPVHGFRVGEVSERPRLLFATPEGDQHEFGILLASLLAAARGIASTYLGASLPASDIASAARRTKSEIVVIGNVPLPPSTMAQPLEAFLRELDRHLPDAVGLWVGGEGARTALKKAGLRRSSAAMPTLEAFDLALESA